MVRRAVSGGEGRESVSRRGDDALDVGVAVGVGTGDESEGAAVSGVVVAAVAVWAHGNG